jgi:hypothetical protein
MFTFSMTITPDLATKAQKMRRLQEGGIYESTARIGQRCADIYLQALKVEAPVSKDEGDPRPRKYPHGTLRDRLRKVQKTSASGYVSFEFRTVPYAVYVINDTRPHRIPGSPLPYPLKWYKGGQMYLAHAVNHPGTKANHFAEKAWAKVHGQIEGEIKRAGRRLLSQVLT